VGRLKRKTKIWNIEREIMERRVNPFELTEFDQWVNETTRKDIKQIVRERKDIFGLKFWDWKILEGEELENVGNFSVDVILDKKDKMKVLELIEKYEKGDISPRKTVYRIFDLAIYDCFWV